MSAPDTYMDKLAVGPKAARVVHLDRTVSDNIRRTARALQKKVSDVTVMVLDRPRNASIIKECRKVGARVRLITDGDVAGAISTCMPRSGVDLLMGSGGSTESVLAAAAMKVLGGEFQARFKPRSDDDAKHVKQYLRKIGIHDIRKIFHVGDLARGKTLTFTATGVIDGPLLDGIRFESERVVTHSIVIRGLSGTIRYITTHHKQ